jgi:hypothetical protein
MSPAKLWTLVTIVAITAFVVGCVVGWMMRGKKLDRETDGYLEGLADIWPSDYRR